MKSSFAIVAADVFAAISTIMMVFAMQTVASYSEKMAKAGTGTKSNQTLEVVVRETGEFDVTGDTSAEKAIVRIHPSARAGDYEGKLTELLSHAGVQSVARVVTAEGASGR